MRDTGTTAHEAAEDIFFGQMVMIWARWFLIAAGVILTLWTVDKATHVVIGTIPIVGLMGMNFYLHGRYLSGRPANAALITVASLLDLAAITVVVLLWPGQSGLASQFFILYYPIVLAFAFVMPRKITVAYTFVALAAYASACLLGDISAFMYYPENSVVPGVDVTAVKALVTRLITLAAIGGLGTFYWRIQRNRRRAVIGGPAGIQSQPASP